MAAESPVEFRYVTAEEAAGTITNRLLFEILDELRRPNREHALRQALYEIADLAAPDSPIERIASEALR